MVGKNTKKNFGNHTFRNYRSNMCISFIIIGYNEGWILEKVFDSIIRSININNLTTYEIIYVDSRSNDNSLEIASRFSEIKKFIILGERNAAIARNIGAKESTGNILFFLDGDMEINPLFVKSVLQENHKLKDFVLTGHLDDHFYTYSRNFILSKPRTYKSHVPDKQELLTTNGGAFVVSKKNWNKVNGMNTKYKINEDYDISIRFKTNNLTISRLPILLAKHHTIDYKDEKRMWILLSQGNDSYSAVLLRNNFFNIKIILHIFRRFYTVFLLSISLITTLIHPNISTILFLLYGIILSFKIVMNTINTISKNKSILKYFFERYIYQIFSDVLFICSFIFFHPQKHSLKYKKL